MSVRTFKRTTYLIDENDNAGKGADVVISLLHNYLERNNDGGILILFADNCVGQNKNNAVIQYLNWRVRTGKNLSIEYNFMLAGHTKFSPDRSFGLVKIMYRKMIVDCLDDFVNCVKESSPNGFNCAIPTVDPNTKKRNVIWSKWTAFLEKYHKPLPGITQFHHFSFFETGIEAKLFVNDRKPQSFDLLVTSLPSETIVDEVVPVGMDAERQWYLFKQIRGFCLDETKKDQVAPMPEMPYQSYSKKRTAEKKKKADPTEKAEKKKKADPTEKAEKKNKADPTEKKKLGKKSA